MVDKIGNEFFMHWKWIDRWETVVNKINEIIDEINKIERIK